jgi:hypothetical protein
MSIDYNHASLAYSLVVCPECGQLVEILTNGPQLGRCPLCLCKWADYSFSKTRHASSVCAVPANPEVSAGLTPETTASKSRKRARKGRQR